MKIQTLRNLAYGSALALASVHGAHTTSSLFTEGTSDFENAHSAALERSTDAHAVYDYNLDNVSSSQALELKYTSKTASTAQYLLWAQLDHNPLKFDTTSGTWFENETVASSKWRAAKVDSTAGKVAIIADSTNLKVPAAGTDTHIVLRALNGSMRVINVHNRDW